MTNPQYPNSGILSRNKDRNPNDEKDREFQGSADVTCPHCGRSSAHWLSAWVKDGRFGKFFKLKFKAKNEQSGGGSGSKSGSSSPPGSRAHDDGRPPF